jgi:hypothetical protein
MNTGSGKWIPGSLPRFGARVRAPVELRIFDAQGAPE